MRHEAYQRTIRQQQAAADPRPVAASLDGYQVAPIPRRDALDLLVQYEWLAKDAPTARRAVGKATVFIGLIAPAGDIHGVACFGGGPGGPIQTLIGAPALCLERGVCVHYAPKNAASYLINRACKLDHQMTGTAIFFAYGDPEAGEYGGVYQAAGWVYLGQGLNGSKGRRLRNFCLPPGADPDNPANWKTTRVFRPRNGQRMGYAEARAKGWTISAASERKPGEVIREAKHVYAIHVGAERQTWRCSFPNLPYPTPRPELKRRAQPKRMPMPIRLTIREQVDRYNATVAARGAQAPASTKAGERSVRQIRYAVGIDFIGRADLITRADEAGMTIGQLKKMADDLGIDTEQACSSKVLSGELPYTGSMGSDWPLAGANRAPPRPVTGPGLYKRLALLGDIAYARALSVNYRAISLGPEYVGACSPWGAMRCQVDLGLDDAICIDAADFLSQLKSAPDAAFSVAIDGNALRWNCGPARGRLPRVDATVAVPVNGGARQCLASDFGKHLELGSLACTSSALARSAGLEGVQIYNRDGRAYAVASDGTMVSSCCLGDALPLPKGAVVTLKPEATALLAEVVKREATVSSASSHVGIDRTSLYCLTSDTELQLHQLAPLSTDIAAKLAPFAAHTMVMPLWRESVAAFLKRAEALAEVRQQTLVELAVTDGTVTLTFREEGRVTEEDYRVVEKDGPRFTVPPIRLEARRLARALADADELVFDYAERHVLVLRGPDEFIFGIAGRRS